MRSRGIDERNSLIEKYFDLVMNVTYKRWRDRNRPVAHRVSRDEFISVMAPDFVRLAETWDKDKHHRFDNYAIYQITLRMGRELHQLFGPFPKKRDAPEIFALSLDEIKDNPDYKRLDIIVDPGESPEDRAAFDWPESIPSGIQFIIGDRDARVIYQIFFNGKSQLEIAQDLGVTQSAISQIVRAVRKKIRANLRFTEASMMMGIGT